VALGGGATEALSALHLAAQQGLDKVRGKG
jgi:hypothetical protein